MSKNITRERLEKIKSWRETYGAGSNVMLPAEEAEELARMALSAMDGEPVAEVVSIYGDPEAFGEREIRPLVGIQQMPYGTKLYRHAKPAPVVPKSISVRQAISALESADAVTTIGQAYKIGWNACRAAMLQELQKSAGDEVISRSNENAQVLNTIKAPPDLDSLPKTGEVQNTNPPENPGCWCRTCRPVVLNDMRFVVCPDCGNKRCPRANDHRNACTGSNEPGQEGSAYPAAPQEVTNGK